MAFPVSPQAETFYEKYEYSPIGEMAALSHRLGTVWQSKLKFREVGGRR